MQGCWSHVKFRRIDIMQHARANEWHKKANSSMHIRNTYFFLKFKSGLLILCWLKDFCAQKLPERCRMERKKLTEENEKRIPQYNQRSFEQYKQRDTCIHGLTICRYMRKYSLTVSKKKTNFRQREKFKYKHRQKQHFWKQSQKQRGKKRHTRHLWVFSTLID